MLLCSAPTLTPKHFKGVHTPKRNGGGRGRGGYLSLKRSDPPPTRPPRTLTPHTPFPPAPPPPAPSSAFGPLGGALLSFPAARGALATPAPHPQRSTPPATALPGSGVARSLWSLGASGPPGEGQHLLAPVLASGA